MITVYRNEDILIKGNESEIEIRGLSTDTKPTSIDSNDIPNGTIFIEIDTEDVYYFSKDTGEWVNKDHQPTQPTTPPTEPPVELLVIDFRECEEECGGYKSDDDELSQQFYEATVAAYQASTPFSYKIINMEGVETTATGLVSIYDEENHTTYADTTDGTNEYMLGVGEGYITVHLPDETEVEEIQG